MARLLADEYGFRVRKVDTIRLMEGRNGRRRVSLDVVVPDDTWLAYDRGLPRAKRLTMVPVARPHKSVMRDLDTHDASGTTLPVLTRQENTDIAASVVVYELLGRRGYDSASPELWQAITSIVGGDSQQSVQDAETLIETGCHAGRRVLDPPDLSELAVHLLRDLAECFLLIALVPQSSAGERVLVKYSFHWGAEDASAERRAVWWRTVRAALGWSDYPLRIGVGGAAEALSHHLEVQGLTPGSWTRGVITRQVAA